LDRCFRRLCPINHFDQLLTTCGGSTSVSVVQTTPVRGLTLPERASDARALVKRYPMSATRIPTGPIGSYLCTVRPSVGKATDVAGSGRSRAARFHPASVAPASYALR